MTIPEGSKKKILELIDRVDAGSFDEAIRTEMDPFVFYNLSSLRAGMVSWLPIEKDMRVLEVNGGFGALTGTLLSMAGTVDVIESDPDCVLALGRRYRGEERLRIIPQDPKSFKCEGPYDCIVITDVRKDGDLIPLLGGWLRDGGFLAAAFRNRIGLQYWCGAADDAVRIPFSGLEDGKDSSLYSPSELRELLKSSGFSSVQGYSVLPDEFFPQAVYAEDEPPRGSIRDRVFAVDPFRGTRTADENRLYDTAAEECLFFQTSDQILYLCRKTASGGEKRRPVYAALSTDRGREHGFATILYSDDTAEKRALFPEGIPSLKAVYENGEHLKERGISIVSQTFSDGRIVMPRIRSASMLSYIEGLKDPDEVSKVFLMMRDDIMRSSDAASIPEDEAERIWGVSSVKLGPVLEKGFIDMIPYNCFWQDGSISYYDQEFSEDRCPVRYILFRAVYYTYIHLPGLEKVIRQSELRSRLGIDEELWKAFLKHENAFVRENRRLDLFQNVYLWAEEARDAGSRRRLPSGSADPARAEEALLEKVHGVQLDLLKEFDRLCEEQGLRYFAIHGTLLGAVRHRGFIPWDDDVDLAMPREDFDKLVSACGDLFRAPYHLQTQESEYRCYYGGYAKLRNSETAAIEVQNAGRDCDQGIWIDIMPLDRCPSSFKKLQKLQKRITFGQRLLLMKKYPGDPFITADIPAKKVSLYWLIKSVVPGRLIRPWLRRLFTSGKRTGKLSILACCYGGAPNRNYYDEEQFSGALRMPFEDMQLPVPRGYEEVLRSRYGEEFMQIPPYNKRRRKHTVYLDPDRSWRDVDPKDVLEGLREANRLSLMR